MDNNTENPQSSTINIKKFVFKIISKWFWIAISLFVAFSIAYFINKYSDPMFSTSATILITDKENAITSGVQDVIEEMGLFKKTAKKVVENEIGILKSYTLNNSTVKELNFRVSYFAIGRIRTPEIYRSSPFVVNLDTSHSQLENTPINVTILSDKEYRLDFGEDINKGKIMKYGEQFSNEKLSFDITLSNKFVPRLLKNNNTFYFIINNLNQLTNRFIQELSIAPIEKKSTIIMLTHTGYVPQKEVDYLNKLCEIFIRKGLEEKNQISLNTIDFIDQQLSIITDSLKIAENDLQNFKLNSKVMDISAEGAAILDKLIKLQTNKAQILEQSKYYDYLIKYIQDKKDFSDIIAPTSIGIQDPLLVSLISGLSLLYNSKAELQYSSKEKNPGLNAINVKIQNARQALLEDVKSIINQTNISLKDIDEQINTVDLQFQKLPITERQLLNFERKYKLNDNIFSFLLEKRAEAGIAKATNIADNRILDEAIIDNVVNVSPKIMINYMVALILGFVLPILFFIIKEFFNDIIIEKSDIENNTKVPILGVIGHNTKGTDLVIYERPKSSISESFRTIRTNLSQLVIPSSEIRYRFVNTPRVGISENCLIIEKNRDDR